MTGIALFSLQCKLLGYEIQNNYPDQGIPEDVLSRSKFLLSLFTSSLGHLVFLDLLYFSVRALKGFLLRSNMYNFAPNHSYPFYKEWPIYSFVRTPDNHWIFCSDLNATKIKYALLGHLPISFSYLRMPSVSCGFVSKNALGRGLARLEDLIKQWKFQ